MTPDTRSQAPERIRVLEFVTSFHAGGTERQFLNLVNALPRERFDVHVACFLGKGLLRHQLDEADERSRPLVEYRFPSLLSPTALIKLASFVRYLRRHRIQVVHSTGLYPNVFAILGAWLARVPVAIASVRDMGHMWSDSLKTLQRWTCRLADMVVCNADAVRRRLEEEGFDPRRIEVIRNGIAAPEARASTAGTTSLRAELGLPDDTPLVGVVSRVDRVKGLETFVEAAAALRKRHPRARFLIIGGPQIGVCNAYLTELEERVRALDLEDRVILTGHRDDVPALLPQLDVSVLCSHTEGLSNTILESMQAGLPMVATDVGGNPELVEEGVTGLLVPAKDPDALAAAIGRLLDDPEWARRLGVAGRRRVDSVYSIERMVADTVDLYVELLGRSRRGRVLSMRGTALPAEGRARALAREGRAR